MALDQPRNTPRLTTGLIALAYTILKHKPDGISAREYVLKLQLRVTTGSLAESRSYIDGVLHWKGLFQESQYEIHQLQGKLGVLEKENEKLRLELANGKRKADDQPMVKKATRRKTKATDAFDCDLTSLTFPETVNLNGNVVLSHLYAAHKLCLNPESSQQDVAHHLISITVALNQHLDQVEEKYLESEEEDSDLDLLTQFRAVSRSFSLALQLLSHISKKVNQKNFIGAAIFKYTKLFHQVLECITKLSVKSFSNNPDAKSKTKHQCALDKFLKSTTQLFLDFIGRLTPSCPAHFQVFEGVMYLVLERCGKLLYIITFGHPQPKNDIIREIMADQETFLGDSSANPETRKAASEAKWMIMLLKRLMAVAPLFYRSSPTPGAATAMTRAPPKIVTRTSAKITLDVKKRLQETLVKCIWDDGDDKEADPFFREALQKPSLNGALPAVPEDANTVIGKHGWFVNEMWKLVGWDILGQRCWDTFEG